LNNEKLSSAVSTADVYAADMQSFAAAMPPDGSIFAITIEAYPEPGVFSQIANLINLANLAPRRARIEPTPQGTLEFYIELAGARSTTIESICRKASQFIAVISAAHRKVI
jgi:hypothetical protein